MTGCISQYLEHIGSKRRSTSHGRDEPGKRRAVICPHLIASRRRCFRISLCIFRIMDSFARRRSQQGIASMSCFDEGTLGQHPKAVFLGGSLKAETPEESKDVEKHRALWAVSLKLADIKNGDTMLKDWL